MGVADVLIVTALEMERDAIRQAALWNDESRSGIRHWDDKDIDKYPDYLLGEYEIAGGGNLTIALARPTRMGGIFMSSIVSTLMERLDPRCLAMCGVCAGNPSDLALGDVAIANTVFQYDEGKRTESGFEGDLFPTPMDVRWTRIAERLTADGLNSYGDPAKSDVILWLLERFSAGADPVKHPAFNRYIPVGTWEKQIKKMERRRLIRRNGRGFTITDHGREFLDASLAYEVDFSSKLPFAIKVGPMASGNAVVKDGVTWEMLKNLGQRSAIALEMEAASIGIAGYARSLSKWIVVKGVMDHSDPKKDDRYKPFAARASAEVLLRFLTQVADDIRVRTPIPPLSKKARKTYASLIKYLLNSQRSDGLFPSYNNLDEHRPSATATSLAILALDECEEIDTEQAVAQALTGLIRFQEEHSGQRFWPAQAGPTPHIHCNGWAILAVARAYRGRDLQHAAAPVEWITGLQNQSTGAFPFFPGAKPSAPSQASVYATAHVLTALLAFCDRPALSSEAGRLRVSVAKSIEKGLCYLGTVRTALRSLGLAGWAANGVNDVTPCLATTSLASHAILRADQQGLYSSQESVNDARMCMASLAEALADQGFDTAALNVRQGELRASFTTWPHIHVTDPGQYFFSYYSPVILRTFVDPILISDHEELFREASRAAVKWMLDQGKTPMPGEERRLVNVGGQRFGVWVAAQAALTLGGALRRRADWFT